MIFRDFLRLCAIVGPLPVTLTNGTVADATQVMADLQFIADQVNANAGGSGSNSGVANLLYNGAMLINQRYGSLGSTTIANARLYTLDRWQGQTGSGMSATYSQITGINNPPFQYAMRVQRTASNAGTTLIQIAQSLESVDSIPLQGQTVTLSFYARSGATYSPANQLLTGAIVTGTGTDENVYVYTGSTIANQTPFQLNVAWQRFQVSALIPTTATEVAVIFSEQPTGTAGAQDYFDITGIQFEVSAAATPFGFPGYADEVERCQRYYQKSFMIGTAPATNTTTNCAIFNSMVVKAGASFFFQSFCLPTRMRDIAATGVIYNPQAANNQIRDTAGFDFSGSSITAIGISATASGTGNASSAVGDQVWFNWSLDAEL